jgi:MFS family permease
MTTTTGNRPSGTIGAALRYSQFRRLLAGLAISQIGDWLYNLALVTLVYERTHSAMWASVAVAARVVPIVVLGPFGGVMADRFDRRRVMVASDLVRLALMVLLAIAAAAHLPIVIVPLIAAAATVAGSPYPSCAASVTPVLVPDADLPGANAARSAVTSLGLIIGPALGGVLLLLGAPWLAFAVNAVTFGLSALAVLAIPANSAFRPARSQEQQQDRPNGLFRDVADGAKVLRAHAHVLQLVGADLMCSLVYGMLTILLLGVAQQAGLGMHGYGYLFAGIGVGALAGASLASRAARCPHPRAVLLLALAAVGLPTMALALVHWGPAAIALVAIVGAGSILVEVVNDTTIQRTLPSEVLGRAYGITLPAAIAGIVLGTLIAPVLTSALGGTGALLACGAAATAYGVVISLPRSAQARVVPVPVPVPVN